MSNSIDDANGSKEISNLFYEKYRRLYNSVPTNANELDDLHHTKSNGILSTLDLVIRSYSTCFYAALTLVTFST